MVKGHLTDCDLHWFTLKKFDQLIQYYYFFNIFILQYTLSTIGASIKTTTLVPNVPMSTVSILQNEVEGKDHRVRNFMDHVFKAMHI